MSRPRHWTRLLAVLLLAALATPASAQSLEQARRERAAVQARLDDAAAQLAQLEATTATLEQDERDAAERVATLEAEAAETLARMARRARAFYKHGSEDPVLEVIATGDPSTALARAGYISNLARGDRASAEAAIAGRILTEEARTVLAARREQLDQARAQQEEVLAGLIADLERAKRLESQLQQEARAAAEAERRRREALSATAGTAGAGPGGYACPIGQPHSFTDTWGAPRSGGRRHQGVDLLAPYGTPDFAIVSGVWDVRRVSRLAGNWGILHGDDGNNYYYMHLQQHVVGDMTRVSVGQTVALTGDTGNARGTPHVHFEYHPGGGGAVNPYPLVRRLCG